MSICGVLLAIDSLHDDDRNQKTPSNNEVAEERGGQEAENLPKAQTTHAHLLCLLVFEACGFLDVFLIGPVEFAVVAVASIRAGNFAILSAESWSDGGIDVVVERARCAVGLVWREVRFRTETTRLGEIAITKVGERVGDSDTRASGSRTRARARAGSRVRREVLENAMIAPALPLCRVDTIGAVTFGHVCVAGCKSSYCGIAKHGIMWLRRLSSKIGLTSIDGWELFVWVLAFIRW